MSFKNRIMESQITNWRTFPIEKLPDCALFTLLSFLPYSQVACLRILSTRFDAIGKKHLNSGIKQIELATSQKLKKIASMVPRRESRRRHHALKNHYHTMERLNDRISSLKFPFTKTFFFPGKLIDEMWNIYRNVDLNSTCQPDWVIFVELNDLIPMALKHFKEVIEPAIPKEDLLKSYTTALLESQGKKIQEQTELIKVLIGKAAEKESIVKEQGRTNERLTVIEKTLKEIQSGISHSSKRKVNLAEKSSSPKGVKRKRKQ